MSKEVQDSLVGTTIADRYDILEVLGEGGYGVVYRGTHNLMDREIAIKVLHARYLKDENNRKRFQREAKAVSRLNHVNIIGVHDFGMTPEGHHFLVMDLAKGTSLGQILDQEGYLPVDRALSIFIQVCAGLSHAHENGIIHRDLKPGNIMIVPNFEGDEIVKILDFGVAKVLPTIGGDIEDLTRTGEIFGTSLYLSPEQCTGRPLDPRSDIYAVGCVMYETLTGLPPHIGENILDTIQKQINEQAVPLIEMREDFKSLPQLDAIVRKTLEKNPDQRFQSANDLKEALEQVKQELASGQVAILSPPPSPVVRTSEPEPTANALPAASMNGTQAEAVPAAKNVAESNAAPVNVSSAPANAAPAPTAAANKVAPSSGTLSKPMIVSAIAAILLLICLGGWFILNNIGSSPGTGSTSLPEPGNTATSGKDPPWMQLNLAGQKALQEGKYEEAQKQFLLGAGEAEKLGAQDRRLLPLLRKVSDTHYILGQDNKAKEIDEKVKSLKKSLGVIEVDSDSSGSLENNGIDNHEDSDRLAGLARECNEAGQYERAERLLKRSIEISQKTFGRGSPQEAERLNDLAFLYLSMGMYDKAEPLFQQVLKIEKSAPKSTSALFKKGMEGYAQLLREAGRETEAKKMESRAQTL